MGLVQVLREEGFQEGYQEGFQKGFQEGYQKEFQKGFQEMLLEGIELGISLRYGEKGLALMDRIAEIKDNDRLLAIKEAIKTTNDMEAFKRLIEGSEI